MVPHLVGKVGKILTEMGLGGSVWVDIEGIRSHMGYKGSEIPKRDLVCYNILKCLLELGLGKNGKVSSQQLEKYKVSGGRIRVPKSLVGPVPTFLTYSGELYCHICQFSFGRIYLINLFIPRLARFGMPPLV